MADATNAPGVVRCEPAPKELSGGNMGKQLTIGIAAVLVLLTQQSALAQLQDTGSADYVVVGCRDGMSGENRQPFRQGLCGGIVQTILYFGRTSFNVCTPEGVTMGQAIRIVVAYIDQRPERMHERFETLAVEVLQQSWPCQKVGGAGVQIAPSTPDPRTH
jgi:hypothetical protein